MNGEVELHDEWAAMSDVSDIDVLASLEGCNAVENRYLLKHITGLLGELDGLRILDVGTGLGESAVYFALKGAAVTATDSSPKMVSFCRELADVHGVGHKLQAFVCAAEELCAHLAAGSYHVVYAANLLHHLADKELFLASARALLRRGGLFASYDPLMSNPVVKLYRKLLPSVHSVKEKPLSLSFLRTATRFFEVVQHREFWLCAQLLFCKYYLWDKYNPNDVRYWKRIHRRGTRLGRGMMGLLHGIDRWMLRMPLVRRWAWNMAIVGRKTE